MHLRVAAFFAGTALLAASGQAHAAFTFCNNMGDPVEAAFGYRNKEGWVSEGWWTIQVGTCVKVYPHDLSERFYFYYARTLTSSAPQGTAGKQQVWRGKYQFCVDPKPFRIEGDDACEARGHTSLGFDEVEVGKQRDFRVNFNP